MSIVSGLATATGVSSLLNAPREGDSGIKPAADRNTQSVASVNLSRVAASTQTARPVLGLSYPDGPDAPLNFRPSRDSRYVMFVKAVQALRMDPESEGMTRAQMSDLMAAARDIFMLDDGIPKQVRPIDVPDAVEQAETRAADRARAEARDRAKRAEDARRAEHADAARDADVQRQAAENVDRAARSDAEIKARASADATKDAAARDTAARDARAKATDGADDAAKAADDRSRAAAEDRARAADMARTHEALERAAPPADPPAAPPVDRAPPDAAFTPFQAVDATVASDEPGPPFTPAQVSSVPASADDRVPEAA